MLAEQAEAGQASRLEGLSVAMDLKGIGIQGDGHLQIDGACVSPRIAWNSNRHIGLNFPSKESDDNKDELPALQRIHTETIALGSETRAASKASRLDEPHTQPDAGPDHEAHETCTKHYAYISRIGFLKDQAVHDGHVLNLASEIDFKHFVRSLPNIRRGNLVLMDNGNIRAIWKDNDGARLGLQFLGGRMVQYVIFKRRNKEQPTSRVTGRDSVEGFERQIYAFELHSLLYE